MENIKKWNKFNNFMATALRALFSIAIRDSEKQKGKKTWRKYMKDIQDNRFNNIAKIQYNKIISQENPIKKGTDMEKVIKNDFGDEFAKKFAYYKNFDYINPADKKDLKTPDGEKLLAAWSENIEDFITGGMKDNRQIFPSLTVINEILTDGYNKIHGTAFEDLEDVYNYANKVYHDNTSKYYNEREVENLAKMKNKTEERKEKAKDYVDDTEAGINTRANSEGISEEKTVKELKYSSDDEDDPRDKAKSAAQQIDEKIKEDAIVTRAALDNDFYSQLPEDIKQTLKNKIDEKKTIIERSKVIRYLLPKERPKWETATMNKGMNPMLARGAWRM